MDIIKVMDEEILIACLHSNNEEVFQTDSDTQTYNFVSAFTTFICMLRT